MADGLCSIRGANPRMSALLGVGLGLVLVEPLAIRAAPLPSSPAVGLAVEWLGIK